MVLTTEEKVFIVEHYFRSYGNGGKFRFLGFECPDVIVDKPLHGGRVTIWCTVFGHWIIDPYFIQDEHPVNQEHYKENINTPFGTKLKVSAKRSYTSKTLFYVAPTNVRKVTLKDHLVPLKKEAVEERSYVLRPNYIPPARQMFYQYCDIMIPEIQEMISRLPKLPAGTKFDPKNGWLPVNFTEQCREIVNKYVMDRVQEELLEDTIKLQQQQNNQPEICEKQYTKEMPSTYCSKMLSNIKKGIYKSVNVMSTNEVKDNTDASVPVHTVDLIQDIDEGELEQVNADDVVNSIPERMEENSDDEHLSQTSDLDIDMEAVEEVNKMIAGVQEDEEVNVVASYLKNKIDL